MSKPFFMLSLLSLKISLYCLLFKFLKIAVPKFLTGITIILEFSKLLDTTRIFKPEPTYFWPDLKISVISFFF